MIALKMLDPQIFSYLLRRVGSAWLVGCAIVVVMVLTGITSLLPEAVLSQLAIAKIAIASGFIGFVSILPFSRQAVRRFAGQSVVEVLDSSLGLFVAFSIGMTIRIVGTVALFLACRYQMVATDREIVTFVLGWYVYLTLIEISLVAWRSHQHAKVLSAEMAKRAEVTESKLTQRASAPRSMASVDG